ncbi:MAG: zinc ribbon domain-containing protein [Firmicutes bacterium]|nr:zinc ribbon domain-containing protein [Bacillota bacterium]
MTSITCPVCKKELSEHAKFCSECGARIKEMETESDHNVCLESEDEAAETAESLTRFEVSAEATESHEPVITTSKHSSRNKIVIAVICIIVIVCGIFVANIIKANREKTYMNDLGEVVDTMYSGALAAEEMGSQIHDVWYNAIFDEDNFETYKFTKGISDFNLALENLFKDISFIVRSERLNDNIDLTDSQMKKLTSPPDKCRDAYDEVKEMYKVYIEFTNMVLSPSGNLQSYTSEYNDLDSEFVKCYQAVKLYI